MVDNRGIEKDFRTIQGDGRADRSAVRVMDR